VKRCDLMSTRADEKGADIDRISVLCMTAKCPILHAVEDQHCVLLVSVVPDMPGSQAPQSATHKRAHAHARTVINARGLRPATSLLLQQLPPSFRNRRQISSALMWLVNPLVLGSLCIVLVFVAVVLRSQKSKYRREARRMKAEFDKYRIEMQAKVGRQHLASAAQ
jgi:hypothetical protein